MTVETIYDSVLGIGEQGVVFMAEIVGKADSRPIMKVSEIDSLSTYDTRFVGANDVAATIIDYFVSSGTSNS